MGRLRLTMSLGVLLVLLGPLAVFVAPARGLAQDAGDITCDDFVRQEAAQALLDADDSYADSLDPDGDGIACNEGEAEDGDTEDEEATEEESPLRARFGSPQEDFEAEYGEPTNEEDAQVYPIGVEYEIDGLAGVNVYYHRGYVAYLTLTADPDSPWSQSEAEEIAFDFLPADWEQRGEPIETSEEDILVPGHSVALETRFGAATYERYGAQGEQGDVFFLLRLDADSDVTAVEIGLGNAEQIPPESEDEETDADQEDDGADAEAAEYLEDVRTQFDRLVASVDEFAAIISDPNFATDQALFDRLVEILVLWTSAETNARALTPPAGFEELHDAFLEYTGLLSGAAVDLTVGLGNGDEARIQEGVDQLGQAIDLQPTVERLLAEAEA